MRGFALTVHCPRCGTAKPMGAEVTPIVTCVTCGLGFDPKPREQPPREPEPEPVALVPSAPTQISEQVTSNDVHLVIRDSVFHGVWLTLVSIVLVLLGYAALTTQSWPFLAVVVGLAPAAAYTGVSRLFGRTYVYVNHETISAWQEPLPRMRERVLVGDIATLTLVPRDNGVGRSVDVVAQQVIGGSRLLLNVSDSDVANEIVAALRKHRARLGAPIRD